MTTISFSQHLACLRVEVWTIMTTAISTLLFSQHLADSGGEHAQRSLHRVRQCGGQAVSYTHLTLPTTAEV